MPRNASPYGGEAQEILAVGGRRVGFLFGEVNVKVHLVLSF